MFYVGPNPLLLLLWGGLGKPRSDQEVLVEMIGIIEEDGDHVSHDQKLPMRGLYGDDVGTVLKCY